MSQKDFLESQVMEEVLREKAGYYGAKEKVRDFWIVNSPDFVKMPEIYSKILKSNFYKQKSTKIISKLNNSESEFYTALITCDFEFIKWIQLRLGYFEDISNILDNNNSFISDGIFGKFDDIKNLKMSPLQYSSDYLHPDILLNRYKKSIEVYYNYN
jgi:hypothetical protein